MRNRIKTIAVGALASALTVAGLAVAQSDGGAGGREDGKARLGERPPGPPPGGLLLGGPDRDRALTYSEAHFVEDGEDVTVRVDKGEVTAVDEDSIAVERNDGETVEVAVDGDTRVLAGPRKRDADVTDIAAGRQAIVVREDGDEAAEAVAVVPKHPLRFRMRHRLGGPPPGAEMPAPPPGFGGEQG